MCCGKAHQNREVGECRRNLARTWHDAHRILVPLENRVGMRRKDCGKADENAMAELLPRGTILHVGALSVVLYCHHLSCIASRAYPFVYPLQAFGMEVYHNRTFAPIEKTCRKKIRKLQYRIIAGYGEPHLPPHSNHIPAPPLEITQ